MCTWSPGNPLQSLTTVILKSSPCRLLWTGLSQALPRMWSFWSSSSSFTSRSYSFSSPLFLLFLFFYVDNFCFVFFLFFFFFSFSLVRLADLAKEGSSTLHHEPVTSTKDKTMLFNHLSAAQESHVSQHLRGLLLVSRMEAKGVRNREESLPSLLFAPLYLT